MSDDLKQRIAKAQQEIDAQKRPVMSETGKGMSLGFRMASDFVAAVIVGLVLGWGIDALFHVSPWGLITCLMFGFATGVRNIVRQASAAQADPDNTNVDGSPPETERTGK